MNAFRRFLRRLEKRLTRKMRFFAAMSRLDLCIQWLREEPESIEYYHAVARVIRHSERLGSLGKRWGYVQ